MALVVGAPTLVHMLLAAAKVNELEELQSTSTDITHVVSQRGSLNRFAFYTKRNWVIGVQRINSTLYLRRYLTTVKIYINAEIFIGSASGF